MKANPKIKIKPRLILLFIVLNMFLGSCRVALIPLYNLKISEEIQNTAKAVDRFYLFMLETTTVENEGRSYSKFAGEYVTLEVEINSLLNQNRIRPLNSNSIRICEITLDLWKKYKEEHKVENTISNGIIKLNRQTFQDLFFAMQVAEDGKKIVDVPPQ